MSQNIIDKILHEIENNIKDHEDLNYFWIHSERYNYIISKIVELYPGGSLQNKKILDIGCYPYHLGLALENLGFEVYGISSEHEPIKNNPRISSLNIETDKFPYPDNFFDLILCTEVLEHLLRTPAIPLREIKRVLNPGGLAVITTPNVLRSQNRISLLIGKSIYPGNKAYYDEEVGDADFYYRHNKEYTLKEMEELIISSGFKIKTKAYFVSYTPFRKRQFPDNFFLKIGKMGNHFFMQIFPTWRDTLYFEIVKQN